MNKKQKKPIWNAPKVVTLVAQGGKTQSGGTESIGCPEVAGEHFFGPGRHRVTSHQCASAIAGAAPSNVAATTDTQIGGANTTTTSPGPS